MTAFLFYGYLLADKLTKIVIIISKRLEIRLKKEF